MYGIFAAFACLRPTFKNPMTKPGHNMYNNMLTTLLKEMHGNNRIIEPYTDT